MMHAIDEARTSSGRCGVERNRRWLDGEGVRMSQDEEMRGKLPIKFNKLQILSKL